MDSDYKNPTLLSASTINCTEVVTSQGEHIGEIQELMIDLESGRVNYAVLAFGGFLGVGNKLFAIPFAALKFDTVNEKVILDVAKEVLENAPGFDKDNWPDTSEHAWLVDVYDYYGYSPYWN